jgi:hypothetical protein
MQLHKKTLINELIKLTTQSITVTTQFTSYPLQQLNFKQQANSWSILQCIDHLNKYAQFYLPEIETQINNAKRQHTESLYFKPGILGNYFANVMLIKNGKLKKMKAPKNMQPTENALTLTVLNDFIKYQKNLLVLLQSAMELNITKIKTAIALTSFIKLKLGDTLRFYVYHVDRHLAQANAIMVG